MKKIIAILFMLTLLSPLALFAGGWNSNSCDTRYPVILAHGMFATDNMLGFINYWWGIEDALEDEGADVYCTAVNCMDSTVNKAVSFKKQFLQILASTRKSRANIIGHSHGGIYTRYAITNLGLGTKVASHTSYCSPQRGSSAADVVMGLFPDSVESFVAGILDVVYIFLLGDSNPSSLDNGLNVTRTYMNGVFNPNTPNIGGIYYQSYATKIKWLTADLILQPTWLIILFYEGANDGLVSTTSAKWGNFRGTESGSWWCGGVSHINAVGHFFGLTPGFSAPDHLVDIVEDLKDRGY